MQVKAIRFMRLSLMVLAVGLLSVAFSESTFAQCVMCRASLGASPSFVRNLNIGVVVLLVPPVSIFCTIFFLAFRNRKSG